MEFYACFFIALSYGIAYSEFDRRRVTQAVAAAQHQRAVLYQTQTVAATVIHYVFQVFVDNDEL